RRGWRRRTPGTAELPFRRRDRSWSRVGRGARVVMGRRADRLGEGRVVRDPDLNTAGPITVRFLDAPVPLMQLVRLHFDASPPEQRRFRRWFFGEIERQVEGAAPIPWTTFVNDETTA